jgi:hypothetical protein
MPTTDAAVALWDDLDAFVGTGSAGSIEMSFAKLAEILGSGARGRPD